MKSKVYFTKNISEANLVKMFDLLNKKLVGNVAVKLHSGEQGNKNFLRPEFVKQLVNHVNGTVVECNTAYGGARNTSSKHLKLLKEHGFSTTFNVALMDEEGPDLEIPVENGIILKTNLVGKNLKKYDSMLVLSHFKGHQMGGYGGALKQLSIGVASSAGKARIHSAGRTDDQYNLWSDLPAQDRFLESMADAASSVVKYFKGNMAFVNVMKNISIDCDCDGNAKPPCMGDIGILVSLDPVAIDRACLDLVYNSKDPGKKDLIARIEKMHGVHTIDMAKKLGIGTDEYELIDVSEEI